VFGEREEEKEGAMAGCMYRQVERDGERGGSGRECPPEPNRPGYEGLLVKVQ
jgi:hypothetical protein